MILLQNIKENKKKYFSVMKEAFFFKYIELFLADIALFTQRFVRARGFRSQFFSCLLILFHKNN